MLETVRWLVHARLIMYKQEFKIQNANKKYEILQKKVWFNQ